MDTKWFICKFENISPVSPRFVQEELHKERQRRAAQRQNKDSETEEIIIGDEEGKDNEEIFIGETGNPLMSVCIQGDADTVDTVLQGCRLRNAYTRFWCFLFLVFLFFSA